MGLKFSKTHIQRAKAQARALDRGYGMAIIKWNNERTEVSGDTKRELRRFAKLPLGAGDYKAVRIVTAGKARHRVQIPTERLPQIPSQLKRRRR